MFGPGRAGEQRHARILVGFPDPQRLRYKRGLIPPATSAKVGGMSIPEPPVAPAPEWLAHRYDPGIDAFQFVSAPRDVRHRVPFLTDEHLGSSGAPVVIPRGRCDRSAATGRINFIFHSAYCCSTLLANAYDRPGRAFSLKEPMLLNDLVGWRHRGGDPRQILAVLGDGLAMLARPFAAGEACVIKPSNIVNGLATAMLAARPEAGAVLLYAPLEPYLGSIASKRLWGRLWVRELLASFLKEGLVDMGLDAEAIFRLSDLQAAAVGWLAQHALFAKLVQRWRERVRTLDSEVLLARPHAALAAIDALFGLTATDDERDGIVQSVFRQHAKFGGAFDAEARKADQQSASALHAEEIAMVLGWAAKVAEGAGIALTLPGALLPPSA